MPKKIVGNNLFNFMFCHVLGKGVVASIIKLYSMYAIFWVYYGVLFPDISCCA